MSIPDADKVFKLRQRYLNDPPDGMTKSMIKNMSDDDLLDMDYFLNEDPDEVFDFLLKDKV